MLNCKVETWFPVQCDLRKQNNFSSNFTVKYSKFRIQQDQDQMPRQYRKSSLAGNNSNSYFSDVSRVIYRQQNLSRKLKHIQEQNSSLEQKIKQQENQIKDERTVIIYQMGELTKAVNNKLNMFEDYKISRTMFMNEEDAHQSLRQLMAKFEAIQKQEKMMARVRNNMEKMFDVYTDHKTSIEQIMDQNNLSHRESEEKTRNLIHEKRSELQNIQQQNTNAQDEIQRMREQMQSFQEQEQLLNNRQTELREMIKNKENMIKDQYKKLEEVSKWTEIVVDKRRKYEIYDGIKAKRKELSGIECTRNLIEVALKEQNLKKY